MVKNLDRLLETINVRVGYEKRAGEANLALLALRDYYKGKNLLDDWTIAIMLGDCERNFKKDNDSGYPARLTDLAEKVITLAAGEFDETLEKSTIAEVIELTEKTGYSGSGDNLRTYLSGYLGNTYKEVRSSKEEKDKKAQVTLELLRAVAFKHAERDLEKASLKNFDKAVETKLKELYKQE